MFLNYIMLANLFYFSTFIYFTLKKYQNNDLFTMPSFEKYCGSRPNIDYLMNITEKTKLCIEGYYPHSIIIDKKINNNNTFKDY